LPPTFRAIAGRVPEGFPVADVIGDALRGQVFVQRFARAGSGWTAADALRIEPVTEWATRLPAGVAVTGPGVAVHEAAIPGAVVRVPAELREPSVEAVLEAGAGLDPLGRDEMFRLEPLYLRGSSAEEKARRDGNAREGVPG
jgi:tRNA threonylcarbamoyladenosine biosynthesis protein TsaB